MALTGTDLLPRLTRAMTETDRFVSRHLSILKGADLVWERREGNRILYSLQPETIANVVGDFLSAVCPTQIVLRRK